jgi:hypothetical protein
MNISMLAKISAAAAFALWAQGASADANTAVVTNTGDNGSNATPLAGSLRAAIKAANAATGPFTIRFNLATGCPSFITLSRLLPDITGNVTVDGTTQPGWKANASFGKFDANLCVYLNGAGKSWAFHVPADAPSGARLYVTGLGFAGFSDAAIKLEAGGSHGVQGSQVGAVPFTLANRNAIRVTGSSAGAFIGGYDNEADVNLIAGSTNEGITLDNAKGGSIVAHNVIGFQADGKGYGGNGMGILVGSSQNAILDNYIGNSAAYGIAMGGFAATGNRVQSNVIGADFSGADAANGLAGVFVDLAANNNAIGSPINAPASVRGNIIHASGGPGVWIYATAGAGNRVLGNAFSGNEGLDIDLGTEGPTANQPGVSNTGPNNRLNHPVLATAVRDTDFGVLTVTGTLAAKPSTTYRFDVYYGQPCSTSPSGRGFAAYPISHTTLKTNALGAASYTIALPTDLIELLAGGISATVTDPAGNTSEIGNCVQESITGNFGWGSP